MARGVQAAARSRIIAAIKREIGGLTGGTVAAGAFEKSIHTKNGHEKGTGHEKGSLIDKLDRVRNVLEPTVAKTVSGGVISPQSVQAKKRR
jgi:hypothetical protein